MQLLRRKALLSFHDDTFGLFVSKQAGVWSAEFFFSGHKISLLIPGTKGRPDEKYLLHAKSLFSNLAVEVEAACGLIEQEQKISRSSLEFIGLNYFFEKFEFALDFVEKGDGSGNCWHVYFQSGKPVGIDYT